ncbi:MAG: dihydroneopterin aldolase [Candidatus Eremiobacteraeota bacterium]|nr:dihydroneopterin aldolase [Candidatus Eremiobacteraeota bacterium]MBV8281930.1 dihydroneopterin aldolase [Candidatus Eremiobacteraeota bacterium]
MADIIRILGMHVAVKIGASEQERMQPQSVDMDLELEVDGGPAARSDDLNDAVDYAQVCASCERVAANRSFALLEALGAACLDAVLSDRRIHAATIRIRKPGILGGATPEVQLRRTNQGKAAVSSATKQSVDARIH